ncbi:uncharacterized protein LOC127863257 [Dreissena polymorpha]|uniref:Uncharacterized protein n=1 Tax=Dreissena polymorpha TaxID=45954 RepID=A0A9D4S6R4_DREPO|nr:uncharacterized protein LOC127863257 [Dreissena polymorpha]KAH3894689.1 hypothetical protein DPMN_018846 [Dreissena polymorpha]
MEICAVLFTCLVAGLALTQAYPLHASCKVQWSLPSVSCQSFSSKIIAQAKLWEKEDNCAGGGERCLYKITDQSAQEIKGTHTTPVKHYVDDISFKLTPAGAGCNVEGFSTSETWYAYLDYGTNYCNLENLITGAGLNTSQGYTETTNDDVCTQFSSHDCDKY